MGDAPRPLLNVADRHGFASPSTHRTEPYGILEGGALSAN